MTLPSDMDGDNMNTLLDDAFDVEDAFLKKFLPKDDAEKLSEKEKDEDDSTDADDTPADDDSDESPEDGAEGDEDSEDKGQRKYADDSDETYVKIKEGDQEHEVSVRDLKRLWGQEAALTKKSQAVADQRKAVEADAQKYVASSQVLLERAMKRFEPFANVDFFLAAQQLSPEEYTALRDQAQTAYEDVKFLQSALDTHMASQAQAQRAALVEAAKSAVKELSGDPEKGGIEGWNEKLYDDIRAYAVTQGVPQETVNTLVDPSAIRVLHKAMLFDRGKSKVVTKKVNKTPKKIVKTTTNPDAARSATKGGGEKVAMAKLRQSGSTDDAADAFLAKWASADD